MNNSLLKTYPFELTPLGYEFDALEPHIDARTVEVHHTKHQQNYVNNLNKVIEENPEYKNWTLQKFFQEEMYIPGDIRDAIMQNAGGIYNHELYFASMTPNSPGAPEGDLLENITGYFGSLDAFKAEFKRMALWLFGSGYVHLAATPQSWLQIITQGNQEVAHASFTPIITLDVWEHAYYLKNENRRAEYFDHWWNTINWKRAEEIYEEIYAKNKPFEFDF